MGNLKNKLNSLRPMMADAAQQILNEWQQDEEGVDEVFGGGGVCDQIALSLIDVIQANTDADVACGAPEGEDHEWVAVSDGQEAFIVDIPAHVYETGGGYSWEKIEGAEISPQDIHIVEVPKEDLEDLFTGTYARDFMYNMSSDGMTDELWQLAKDDAKLWGRLGVNKEKERNLYFYLDNFYDDLCEEFGCNQEDAKEDIITFAFNKLKNKEKVDLTDIRKAIYLAIRNISPTHKIAYPNIYLDNIRQPTRDVDKWVRTLNEIYSAVQHGEHLDTATQRITEGWNPMEKMNFEAWKRFYDKGEHKKYAVAYTVDFPFTNEEEIKLPEDTSEIRRPGRPRKKLKTPEDIKRSLISRLDSADKLLREFSHVWPTNVWNRLHSSLNDLKREVMMLRSASTMRDVIVKTAGVWARNGFEEGAELLEKIAQPPMEEGDVASEIEQALTGARPEKPAAEEPVAPDMGDEMPNEEMAMPPEDLGEMPPGEAGDELPMPEPPIGEDEPAEIPEGLEEKPKEDADVDENPYVGSTIKDVVEVLEPVVLELKERAVARELAKVDMMLDAQNIASHFPELGEAMNKVLESNTYVTTRLDKLLTKVKGGLQEMEKEETTSGPDIDMSELTAPEESDLEVLEEMPPEVAQPKIPQAPVAEEAAEPELEVRETPELGE